MKHILFGLFFIMMTKSYGQEPKRFLALGDSYTVGEKVEQSQTWPYQLASYLSENDAGVAQPEVIAVTGWRTDELLDSIAQQNFKPNSFELVSLLIGVNNQYQNKPFKTFKIEFEHLVQVAIELCSGDQKGVFLVGIPDYSLSPFAKEKQLKGVSSSLKRYNRFIRKMSKKYKLNYYPLQKLSKPLHKNPSMLAEDLLHPNADQYKVWVNSFKESVLQQLNTF